MGGLVKCYKTKVEFPMIQILSYAAGHVMNDMCAACWFSYLLVLLHKVVGLSHVESAIVMFSGQFADGVATPLVGIWSDKTNGIKKLGFGRRKTWLAGGALVVVFCFYMVFGPSALYWFYQDPGNTTRVVYYSVGAALFNVGWAAVQVSHMALVPEISKDDGVRCILNSYRYAFTILSNVTIFCVFLGLLKYVDPVQVPDQFKFQILTYTSIIIGSICVLYFLIYTVERPPEEVEDITTSEPCLTPEIIVAASRGPVESHFESKLQPTEVSKALLKSKEVKLWWHWFAVSAFYQLGVIYMCMRLVINITQVYMSFFLITTLQESAASIAQVPLIMYVSGFIITFYMSSINDLMGRAGSFFLGSIATVGSLALMYHLDQQSSQWLYLLAAVLGIGNSIIMITTVCMVGDLVGDNTTSGAFVYGAMSFTDKISNGIAIFIFQNGREAIQLTNPEDENRDGNYIRNVMCVFPSIIMVVGVIMNLYISFISRATTRTKRGLRGAIRGHYGSISD